MPTFSGPLRVKSKNEGSTDTNVATVAETRVLDFTFEDTALTATLPKNSELLDITVDVTTAFTNVTTALVNIGNSTNATLYMASVNAEAAGRTLASGTAANLDNLTNVGTDGTIAVTLAGTGYANANAGAGRIILSYLRPE